LMGAAARRGCQRTARTFAEVKPKMAEGQLRHFVRGGDEPPRDRVRFDLQGLLDRNSKFFVLDHDVESDQRVEWIFERIGEEDASPQYLVFQQRGFNFDRPELR